MSASKRLCEVCSDVFSLPTTVSAASVYRTKDLPLNWLKEYVIPAKIIEQNSVKCEGCYVIWRTAQYSIEKKISVRSQWVDNGKFLKLYIDDVGNLKWRTRLFGWFMKDSMHPVPVGEDAVPPYDAGPGEGKLFRYFKNCFTQCEGKYVDHPDHQPLLPSRIMDFGHRRGDDDIRIIEPNGIRARYAVLSYSWGPPGHGGDQPQQLRQANRNSYYSGFQSNTLPQTIQDAIKVTREMLGLQYLWVDAYCIIQDDPEDKNEQISKMAGFYDNATVTIAAACASSAESGFLHQAERPATYRLDLPTTDGVRTLILRESSDIQGEISGKSTIDPLETRAWCLEERLLSHRFVSFPNSGPAVEYWCQHGVQTSDGGRASRPNFRHHAETLLQDPALRPSEYGDDSELYQLNQWFELVGNYSSRGMTEKQDKLRACAGLAKKFFQYANRSEKAQHFMPSVQLSCSKNDGKIIEAQDDYCAGLWGRSIHECLLWRSRPSGPRIAEQYSPSWSWSSTTGRVNWLVTGRRLDENAFYLQVLGYEANLKSSKIPHGALRKAVLSVRTKLRPMENHFNPHGNDVTWSSQLAGTQVLISFDEGARHEQHPPGSLQVTTATAEALTPESVSMYDDDPDPYRHDDDELSSDGDDDDTESKQEANAEPVKPAPEVDTDLHRHHCLQTQQLFLLPVGQSKGVLYGLVVCKDCNDGYSRVGAFKCFMFEQSYESLFDECEEDIYRLA